MALTIYQPIEPDGNFPAVKAKDVEMPDGTRLGDLDLGSMNVVTYDLAAMGVPNLVLDGNPLNLETDTTEIAEAMATNIVTVNLNVEYKGLVFNNVKATFPPNCNVATVTLLTTVVFVSMFVTEGKIAIGAEIAKQELTGAGHAVQDTPPEDTSVLWVDPTDNSDDGFQEAVKAALAQANCGISVSGATVGQTVMIAEVDEKGVPTAWEAVDFPSCGGGGEWKLFADITTEEDVYEITIDEGIPDGVTGVYFHAIAKYVESSSYNYLAFQVNGKDAFAGNKSIKDSNQYYDCLLEIHEDGTGHQTHRYSNMYASNANFGKSCATISPRNDLLPVTSIGVRCGGSNLKMAAGAIIQIYVRC